MAQTLKPDDLRLVFKVEYATVHNMIRLHEHLDAQYQEARSLIDQSSTNPERAALAEEMTVFLHWRTDVNSLGAAGAFIKFFNWLEIALGQLFAQAAANVPDPGNLASQIKYLERARIIDNPEPFFRAVRIRNRTVHYMHECVDLTVLARLLSDVAAELIKMKIIEPDDLDPNYRIVEWGYMPVDESEQAEDLTDY
jgi:hypothetical protein